MSWEGEEAFYAALDRIASAADAATKELVNVGSLTLTVAAKDNFIGSHRRGEPHVGGNRPNIVSGNLRRSIRSDPITRFGMADYGTSVAPRMIYSRAVELGFHGSPGYPYFGPAVDKTRPEFRRQAVEIWAKHMNRAV